MSHRSRAVPWFLERPPYYVRISAIAGGGALGHVPVRGPLFSFDERTWFNRFGKASPGFYLPRDRPPPGVLEAFPLLVPLLNEYEQQARDASDRFLGELIGRPPTTARA